MGWAVIRLVLPYPISANRYWRPLPVAGRNIFVPSKEAKAYKAAVQSAAIDAGIHAPIVGRVIYAALKREAGRLAAGQTYEPPTFREPRRMAVQAG